LHKAESANSTGIFPWVIIQCGHKKVLKEAFRSTPVGVTTANQPDYDLILDIRAIHHLLCASIHPHFSEEANVPSQHPAQDLVLSTDYVNKPSFENHQLAVASNPLSHVITVLHGNKAITGDIRSIIYDLEYADPLKNKLLKDNYWTSHQFDLVDWVAYKTAFTKILRSHRISISKLSHQLWNTNFQNNKYYGQLETCPICQHMSESSEHIFWCPHRDATSHCKDAFSHLLTSLQKSTPQIILEAIQSGIQQWSKGGVVSPSSPTKGSRLPAFRVVNDAFDAQTSIGWDAFHRGHVAYLWRQAFRLNFQSKKKPSDEQLAKIEEKWLRLLVTSVWTYSKKKWKFRNKVVHGQTEHFKQSKASRILQETVRNLYQQFAVDPFMLPESRRYLFNRPIEATLQMDPESLKAWKRSVKEGLFTREHREQLAAKAFKRTLHCFFPYLLDSRKVVTAKCSSL